MVTGPAVAASPGNLLEMEIFGSTPDLLNYILLRWDPGNLF